ncbi:MAG: ABC transporter ATP-binding protein [Phycisphaerales bacterium]
MREFIVFARRVVRDRGVLVFAVLAAIISAVNMGAGVGMLVPMFRLMRPDGKTLPEMAADFNTDPAVILGQTITIPAGLVERLPADRFEGVLAVISVVALLTMIGAAANFLHQYLSITVAARSIANAREELFRASVNMPVVRNSGRGASEFVSRIIRDTSELQQALVAVMSRAVGETSIALVMFVVAIIMGRSITLAALLVVPVMAVFLRKVGKRIRRGTRGALQGQEELLRVATETVQGLRVIKSNRAEPFVMGRFVDANRRVVRETLRAQLTRAFASPFTELLAVLIVGGLMVFASRAIIGGTVSMDRVLFALFALGLAGSKLKILSQLINDLQGADATASRLLEILDEPVEEDAPDAIALPRHTQEIHFDDVVYAYPGAAGPAVDGINLRLRHGERVAIVGPNGCGKSTLLSLLPRLILPASGAIRIDGHDIAGVTMSSLREQIAVVTQDSVLLRGTVAENIRLGRPDATDAEVVAAARTARADSFIDPLPGGYEADIAEQGASLSGGQRQRLCIARAILRDPSILILDEATSQIDAESEAMITEAINEFCRNRTVLLIAHRLATVLDADRIVVMNAGRIEAQGTHAELLESSDLYARLSRTQLVTAEP